MNGRLHDHGSTARLGLLREVVFGLEDGLVSTMGALVGIAIGTQNTYVVILSGLVIITVESLSMAAGSFLSSKTELEAQSHLLDEERREIQEVPKEEIKELREIYRKQGFSAKEVEILVRRVTANKSLWLQEMAHHELGIIPDATPPSSRAGVMGFSYILGGAVPLIPFFFLSVRAGVTVSVLLSVVSLFGVGAAKTKFTKRSWLRSGAEMMMISLSAAVLGYFIGWGAQQIFEVRI